MANNRPKSREKNVTESSKGVKKRGSGLGSGSVGNRETASKQSKSQSSGNTVRESGGKKSPLWKILILVVALLGGGGGAAGMLGGLFGNDTLENSSNTGANNGGAVVGELLDSMTSGTTETGSLSDLGSTLSGLGSLLNSGTTSNGWELNSNTGKLNTSVASAAREKRTEILGDNQDIVTLY